MSVSINLIKPYIDALWLEKGLSDNTLASYATDLQQLHNYLDQRGYTLVSAEAHVLMGFLATRSQAGIQPRSLACNLSSIEGFYQYMVRENRLNDNPAALIFGSAVIDPVTDFKNLVNKEVISFLFKGEIPQETADTIQEAKSRRREKTQTTKENIPNLDERSAQNRAAGNTQRNQEVVETIVRDKPKIGRNDRVTIKHVIKGENKTLKYKQAEPLIAKGEWVLVEE
mgnify:CR=1 FL=1